MRRRATTLPRSAGTRYTGVRARGHDIIQPKAPKKGEGLLCPSVPRAKDRAARCRLTILATVRPSVHMHSHSSARALPYRRAHVCARTYAHAHPPNVGVRMRTSLLSSTLTGIAYPSWVFLVLALVVYRSARLSRVLALFP